MATAVNPQTGERIQFDEASQQWIPAEPDPQAQQPQAAEQPPQDDSFFGASVIEPAATLVSGAIAEPVAGMAGLGSLMLGRGPEQAQREIEAMREAMTFQPRTQAGRESIQAIGESAPMQFIAKELQATEKGLGDVGAGAAKFVGGGEQAQAVVGGISQAIPTAILEALGLKGVSKVRGAKKLTGLTDDVVDSLKKSGIDVDDLSDAGIAKMQKQVSLQAEDQIKRAKLFQEIDVPTVKSRITREQVDFLEERQLARAAGTKESALLQERRAAEAAGFQDATRKIQDSLGIPEDAGALIKEALDARISGVASKTKEAYKKLGDLTEGNSIPIIGNKILEKLHDKTTSALSGRLDKAERAALNDLFIEFGLDTDLNRVGAWTSGRAATSGALPGKSSVTPLSLSNIEEFRQALSNMTGFDASANLRGVAGALKRGVDDELFALDAALKASTGAMAQQSKGVLSAARRARALFKGRKSLENTDGLIGRLTRSKPRTPDEPLILASEITKKLFGTTRDGSIENVGRVIGQLERAGEKGTKALSSLQSAAVADLLNAGTAISKLPGDVPMWLGNQFAKRFDKLNQSGKLERIFKNNPQDLAMIKKLREAGELTVPFSDVAKASGTTDDFLNALTRNPILKRVIQLGGGVGGVVATEGAERVVKGATSRKAGAAVKRALSMKPDDAVIIQQTRRLFPNLAAVLAPAQLRDKEE